MKKTVIDSFQVVARWLRYNIYEQMYLNVKIQNFGVCLKLVW